MNKKELQKIEKTLKKTIEVDGGILNDDTDLTYQQKVFVIKYCQHYNGTQAALEAGYAQKSAHNASSDLLKVPAVQNAILKRQQALQIASAVTREYVLSELVDIIEEVRAQDKPNNLIKMKALEMISKIAGFSSPDTQFNIQNNIDSIKIEIVKKVGDGN